ncbi:MAG: PrsW family glutamic-type intramembrane protease [Thermoanaerobaculia bacterium]|nr:PrsW family glutamic-type intramembrane protease [Thermoanaerobaculia bacterium]
MAEQWYYFVDVAKLGPVDREELIRRARDGRIQKSTLVWCEGMKEYAAASALEFLFPPEAVAPSPVPEAGTQKAPEAPAAPQPVFRERRGPRSQRDLAGMLGAKLSQIADLPTISNINVKEILIGGLMRKTGEDEIEEIFVAGTLQTTPAITDIKEGWPSPRIFWRILGGFLGAYALMGIGLSTFQDANFVPGLIVLGSFVVPLSCVILFFELNTPRNVSIYQVLKMIIVGGAMSILLTLFFFRFLPGAGTGELVPAFLTAIGEETAKMLTLLLVVSSMRYPWQLNGILFGSAVGAGFAGFESAGYAYRSGTELFSSIFLRAILAPGGHVIWTAMVGAAIWRVKGNKEFRFQMLLHPIVIRRWGIAVVLHGLWNSTVPGVPWFVKMAILSVIGWYLIFAMLKQAYGGLSQVKAAATAAVVSLRGGVPRAPRPAP